MALYDSLDLLKTLSVKKMWNALQVYSTYFFSRTFKKNFHRGLPISVSIEPTTSCNLRCPECPSGLRSFSRPTGMLDEFFFRTTIDQLSDRLIYLTLDRKSTRLNSSH